MRTKVLMTIFYIMLAIFVISMVFFIFTILQPGKYGMALWSNTIGYISAITMLILMSIKNKWDKCFPRPSRCGSVPTASLRCQCPLPFRMSGFIPGVQGVSANNTIPGHHR